jgi:hypothetical protein
MALLDLQLLGAAVAASLALLAGCATGNSSGSLTNGAGGSTSSSSASSSSGVITGAGGGSSTSSSSSSSSSTTTAASSSSSSSGTGGGSSSGGALGATCTTGTDCQSGLCKPVVIQTPPVCVTPCASQADCGAGTTFFCEPITAGSPDGYCIPESPAHCLSCTQDSDCGSLSEVCFQAPGDNSMACNIDCSLAGQSACPSDYSCVMETVAGQPRQLCRPTTVATCLDAIGGYCDRLTVPQACTRTNTAGSCLGQRVCMSGNERFDSCNAESPQCKADCSDQDPAGCTESFCASATSTVTDCGTCGYDCPGDDHMSGTVLHDNVTCTAAQTCTFSCEGENYDVDGTPADGCEVAASPQGNHVQSAAAAGGSAPECDNNSLAQIDITGHLPSDTRAHANPAIIGFDAATGSAPDWWTLFPLQGNDCDNDIVMQLTVTNSSSPACYKLTVITNLVAAGYTCQTDASGTCPPDPNPSGSCTQTTTGAGICKNNGGQWSDSGNNTIYIEVSKTCSTNVCEDASYTVSGHL